MDLVHNADWAAGETLIGHKEIPTCVAIILMSRDGHIISQDPKCIFEFRELLSCL